LAQEQGGSKYIMRLWAQNAAFSGCASKPKLLVQIRTYIESTFGMSKRMVNEKLNAKNRLKWLDQVPQAVTPSTVRKQKDGYLRELLHVGSEASPLNIGDKKSRLPADSIEKKLVRSLISINPVGVTENKKKNIQEDITEALQMYRLMRPDAPPFYEEDAMLHLERSLNKECNAPEKSNTSLEALKNKYISYQGCVPVVNADAFLLALQSVTASLADDLAYFMTTWLAVPHDSFPPLDDPFRFAKLMDILFDDVFVGLEKCEDEQEREGNIKEWMNRHWATISDLLPPDLRALDDALIAEWLHGHIGRVIHNQKEDGKRIWQGLTDDRTYRFSEDFAYDQYPLTPQFVDQRNMDFPLNDAGKYMERLLDWSGHCDDPKEAGESFQEFVFDLEKIGLRNWLKMDVKEMTSKLPNWRTGGLGVGNKQLKTDPETQRVAQLMLRCASRGKSNLLDFEAVDPQTLLHDLPHDAIDDELKTMPAHRFVSDEELNACVSGLIKTVSENNGTQLFREDKPDGSPLQMEQVVQEEMNQYRKYGPVRWDEEHSKFEWTKPAGTNYDERRKSYIPEQKMDPMLQISKGNMRQVMVKLNRMGSMTKSGRVYYFRAIVAVGNGRGIYGFGVGFGNNMKEAKADGAIKALQNLEHLDYDDLRMLCTPCKGEEYSQRVEIIPRPIGRGVVCNKKFLPLVYLLGLDNVKIRFQGKEWFSRVKALKRALDMIVSRRTLANMTGQKYALLVAPGDHWVHWLLGVEWAFYG